jgi:hypothetical protein
MPHATKRNPTEITAFRLGTCHPLEWLAQRFYFVPIRPLRLQQTNKRHGGAEADRIGAAVRGYFSLFDAGGFSP